MKIQLARNVFLEQLTVMKQILNLAEFKFDNSTKEYKYFKSQIMDSFFRGLKKIFCTLEENKIIEKCPCRAKIRQGYKNCKDCGGSGYRNITK